MFLQQQPKDQRDYYENLLKAVGSLSGLFSDSAEPYLAYRATENLFCKAFKAQNLSRGDTSADASKDRIGFGLKTFLNKNGKTMQKIAEFNGQHALFKDLTGLDKVKKISELRNIRLETTKRIHDLDEIIYHCIVRTIGRIIIYEIPAHQINIDKIKIINTSSRQSTIKFSDSVCEYSFNVSKSTLYMRFITPKETLLDIPVKVLEDPFSEIEKLIIEHGFVFTPIKVQPHIFLPLYSVKGGVINVPTGSGLNQWNAKGRKRNPDEVYIPVPAWIHKKFPNFFPPTQERFELVLPNNAEPLSARICQEGRKALMSNPNDKLGKWILRDILKINRGELVTYDKLEEMDLDAVVVYKVDNDTYDIDFAKTGSYESFLAENGEINFKDDLFDVEDENEEDEEGGDEDLNE